MDKSIFRKIEYALYNYDKIFRSAVKSTVEWAESNGAVDYSKERVQTSPDRKKEAKLCEIIDYSTEAVRWCEVIDKVFEHYKFEPTKCRLLRLKYFQKKTVVAVCKELKISRSTYFYWRDEIFLLLEQWAIELKTIKIPNKS